MTAAARETLMSVEQFLDWCPDDERWELIGGIPWRMMAESDLHEQVKSNVHIAVGKRLSPPSPCRAAVDGRQVRIDAATTYRPDIHVNCAPLTDPMAAEIQKPTIVFEVAVTSLERDLTDKRVGYFRNPHVEHVVIVDAVGRKVHHFARGSAVETVLRDGDTLNLDGTAPLALPVTEFFHFLP